MPPDVLLRECSCPVPEPKIQKPSICVKCGHLIPERWSSNDRTLAAWLDRFSRTFPSWPHLPEWWETFRLHIESRERSGRKSFRQSFHGRQNLQEAKEEVCDLALYAFLDGLVQRRAGGEHDEDVAMEIAHHAAEAYRLLDLLRHKRHGVP